MVTLPPTAPRPPDPAPGPASGAPVRRGRGRPRQADVDTRIEAAALTLLRSGGPAAVHVEAVAAESGVAKTTIYRRYANRGELLRTVLGTSIGGAVTVPDGTVREKIGFALEQAWRQMADVLGPGGLAAIVMDADPEFTELFRRALQPYEEALIAEIRADESAGLLRDDVDADGVVTLFLGAYLGQLVRRGSVDDEWLARAIDLMWRLLERDS